MSLRSKIVRFDDSGNVQNNLIEVSKKDKKKQFPDFEKKGKPKTNRDELAEAIRRLLAAKLRARRAKETDENKRKKIDQILANFE